MDIQARLYWQIIRVNMNRDPYFKNFKLANYRFIVVNRRTLTPLVWEFGATQSSMPLVLKDGTILRHPCTVGEELSKYLINKPRVPNGINLIKPNKLDDYI